MIEQEAALKVQGETTAVEPGTLVKTWQKITFFLPETQIVDAGATLLYVKSEQPSFISFAHYFLLPNGKLGGVSTYNDVLSWLVFFRCKIISKNKLNNSHIIDWPI